MEVVNMKNMVVLKNLPSNIVEEAFVVIKPNKMIKEKDLVKKEEKRQGEIKTKNSRDYVVKEAEMVISNYISNIESDRKKKSNKKWENKYKNLKKLAIFSNILLLISLIFNFIR